MYRLCRRDLIVIKGMFDAGKAAKPKLFIAILDIDNFRNINGLYWRTIGDQGLVCVASTISREARQNDIVGRIRGEEFALLLPLTGKEDAGNLMNRLRAIVAASGPHARGDDMVRTLSAGLDEFDGCDAQLSVMARAAPAFYAARANGKNCVMAAAFSQYRIVGSIDTTAFESVFLADGCSSCPVIQMGRPGKSARPVGASSRVDASGEIVPVDRTPPG